MARRVLRNKQPLNCGLRFVTRVDGLCRKREQIFLSLSTALSSLIHSSCSLSLNFRFLFCPFPFSPFRKHHFACLYRQRERKLETGLELSVGIYVPPLSTVGFCLFSFCLTFILLSSSSFCFERSESFYRFSR